MKKLFAVITLLCSVASFSLFAEDVKAGSVKAPGKGKVVIVGRVSYKNPVNTEEYKNILSGGKPEKYKKPNYYSVGDYTKLGSRLFESEEPFYYTAKVEKDGTVTIPFFQVSVAQQTYWYYRLPAQIKIQIPEGASYVYIGNFCYDLDYALRVKDFKHYDEFDKAEKWINRATGKDCDLFRAEFEFLK